MNPAFVSLIAIVIAILCIVLAFRFGKVFFKVFTAVFFVLIVGAIIFGALVASDAMNFKEGVSRGSSLFLLEKEDDVLAGVVLKPVYQSTGADIYEQRLVNASTKDIKEKGHLQTREEQEESEIPFKFPSENEFNNFKDNYKEGDLDAISSSYYKLFIFDVSIFEGREDEILSFGELEFSIGEGLNVLESDNPFNTLVELISEKEGMLVQDVEDAINENLEGDIRGVVFALMLGNVIGEDFRDIMPVMGYFREKTITVYPKSIMFSVLGGVPESLMQVVLENMKLEE